MDLSAESGTPTAHATGGGPAVEQELSLSSTRSEAESGSTVLLQLLEFKRHLLEAVEELHIRKDAENRFEDQIGKLAVDKQELQWEKESLQHQIETAENQHAESITTAKKQFQAKIRNVEEEKGRYQVSAELKDKEINNLKEELRSLQLLNYNLEKKSNELEQKLALQSRSKDSHLSQLGEVERRFSALSRQCAMVKQAHEKLEQSVDEALSVNKELTSTNEQHEAAVVSLKQELEEVNRKWIKAKMASVREYRSHSQTGKEQHIQKLQQRLNVETEMNKKLREENESVRAEKQEVMRSLQHAQQLLLSQTQAVNRAELELQTQREQYQALKQEHEVMRDKSKAAEDKVARLMESSAASQTSWDKEKRTFPDCVKSERQDLQAAKEAYEELRQERAEPRPLAKEQTLPAQMRSSSQRGEPRAASSRTAGPDALEDAAAAAELVATGATGGQEALSRRWPSQLKQPSRPSTCPLITASTGSSSVFHTFIKTSKTRESYPDAASHFLYTASSVSDNNPLTSKSGCASDAAPSSSPDRRPVDGPAASLGKEESQEGNRGVDENNHGGKGEGKDSAKDQERDAEQQRRSGAQGEDATGGGAFTAQTAGPAGRGEDGHGSAEDSGDARNPETETRDRAAGQGPVEEEERGKTETQIPTQTTSDRTPEKSSARQVVDIVDTEPPLAVSEPSDGEEETDASRGNEGCGIGSGRELLHALSSERGTSVDQGPSPDVQVQNLCHDEVHSQDAEPLRPSPAGEKPTDKSAADSPAELSDGAASIPELGTTSPQALPSSPGVRRDVKQTDEMCDEHAREELVPKLVDPQPLSQSQEVSEQENGPLASLVTDDDDGGGGGSRTKSEGESNVDARETFDSEAACVGLAADAGALGAEVESGGCRGNGKYDKTDNAGDTKTNERVPPTGPSSLFDLASALRQFVQGSEQNTSSGRLGRPPSTIPMFPTSKHSRVPLAISGAADLPGVSGSAASSTGCRQGERRALGGPCGESAGGPSTCWEASAATKATEESRAPLAVGPFPASSSSSTSSGGAVGGPARQPSPGCSGAPTSAAGLTAESDLECSQEREERQSSFRAQITKIERFLSAERLRLPKRRRTDD